jgi:hypothetical protein
MVFAGQTGDLQVLQAGLLGRKRKADTAARIGEIDLFRRLSYDR